MTEHTKGANQYKADPRQMIFLAKWQDPKAKHLVMHTSPQ